MPLACTYAVWGSVPGRRRPLCVRAHRAWATDGGGKGHGRGRWERLRWPSARLLASDLAFQDACSLPSSPPSPGSGSGRVSWTPRASVIRLFAASAWTGSRARSRPAPRRCPAAGGEEEAGQDGWFFIPDDEILCEVPA